MPRVCLTEKQRQAAAIGRVYKSLADALAVKKNREGLRNEDLGLMLGMNRKAVGKFLRCEKMQISMESILKIIYVLGLEVRVCDRT